MLYYACVEGRRPRQLAVYRGVSMFITLEKRTADSVRTYFEKANRPEIKQVLPQKARTIEEALQDYE